MVHIALKPTEGATHTWEARWHDRNKITINIFYTSAHDIFHGADRISDRQYDIQLAHFFQRELNIE
jgi:hypothetical protein